MQDSHDQLQSFNVSWGKNTAPKFKVEFSQQNLERSIRYGLLEIL